VSKVKGQCQLSPKSNFTTWLLQFLISSFSTHLTLLERATAVTFLSVCLSVRLSVRLSVCLSVCQTRA